MNHLEIVAEQLIKAKIEVREVEKLNKDNIHISLSRTMFREKGREFRSIFSSLSFAYFEY